MEFGGFGFDPLDWHGYLALLTARASRTSCWTWRTRVLLGTPESSFQITRRPDSYDGDPRHRGLHANLPVPPALSMVTILNVTRFGSFKKIRSPKTDPKSRALITRTPTKRTPNYRNSHLGLERKVDAFHPTFAVGPKLAILFHAFAVQVGSLFGVFRTLTKGSVVVMTTPSVYFLPNHNLTNSTWGAYQWLVATAMAWS